MIFFGLLSSLFSTRSDGSKPIFGLIFGFTGGFNLTFQKWFVIFLMKITARLIMNIVQQRNFCLKCLIAISSNWGYWFFNKCCSLVSSMGEALENIFGYFAFWVALNIALVALGEWIVMIRLFLGEFLHCWEFGGMKLGSQTSIPASKQLWIQHWTLSSVSFTFLSYWKTSDLHLLSQDIYEKELS